jgi:hypothetical protein
MACAVSVAAKFLPKGSTRWLEDYPASSISQEGWPESGGICTLKREGKESGV